MLPYLTVLAFVLAIRPLQAPGPSHQVKHLIVAPGTQLEVLDWGGRGPAMVFLAGFGDTGHAFDSFAPQFAKQYHVIAITRRGFGASSRPATGYDTRTLAHDIVSILDTLGIRSATFVGHSFAGSELNYLGAFHADHVAQLIYLDASYDFARLYADSIWQHSFPIPRPTIPAPNDAAGWRRWFFLAMGPGLPDDEISALRAASSAALVEPLERGAARASFDRIRAPVLAIWANPESVSDQYPYATSLDAASSARLQASFMAQQSVRRTHLAQFRASVSQAHVVLVPGGRHYVFLSHSRFVADAMRAFLAPLRQQPNTR